MNKSIIITGATGHLGSAVTHRLLADRYRLYVTLMPGEKAPEDPHIHGMHIDLMNEGDCARYVSEVAARGDALSAGILLVGGFQMGGLAEATLADIDRMLQLNFYTAYAMAKALYGYFERSGGGQILLIGARPALQPADGQATVAYSLSKSLVFRLAELINESGKSKNISATVLVPSTIDTPQNRASMPDADFAKWVPAASIADVVAFLLTDSGHMVRETVVKVYNGA